MAKKTTPTRVTLIAASLATGVLWGACKTRELNPDHCTNNEGNQYCAERNPAAPFCSDGMRGECNATSPTGCVSGVDLAEGCNDPCGVLSDDECEGVAGSSSGSTGDTDTTGDTTDGEQTNTGTDDTAETTDTGSTDTGPALCMGPEDCAESAAPYCSEEGECVTCDEAPSVEDGNEACAAADAMTPACTPDGACVTCTEAVTQVCDEQLLLCDGETNTCIPCVEHADCVSGACHIAEGTCFPNDAAVSHVDGDGGQDFTSITAATDAIADGDYGIIFVHELNGENPYTGGLTVGGGKTLALFAEPGEDPIVLGTGGDPGLSITGAETAVYIEAVDFVANSMGLGLLVDAGTAWVDRSRIVQNSGGGVLAANSANLIMRNCFVGQGDSEIDSVTIDSANANILYTTVVAGDGGLSESRALRCTNSTVDVRNSLVLSVDDVNEITCSGLTMTYSASENMQAGAGNEALMSIEAGWLTNVSSDYHLLTPPGIVLTTAQWQGGDPLVDIDGEDRPNVDGSPDAAGADVP